MVTTGCVVNAEPLTAPAALVLSVACVAVPKVGLMICAAEVKPLDAKVRM